MNIDVYKIRFNFNQMSAKNSSISNAFKEFFNYIREHHEIFYRIFCQNVHISHHGNKWDYMKLGKGYIVTRSRLIFVLKREINATLFDMPISKGWINGFSDKRDLLKTLEDSKNSYFLVRFNVHHKISYVADVTGKTFFKAIYGIKNDIKERNRLFTALSNVKNNLDQKPSVIILNESMFYLKKLSRGQSFIGQYYIHAVDTIESLGVHFPKVLTHAKSVAYLKRLISNKKYLSIHKQAKKVLNNISNSNIGYFKKTDNLLTPLNCVELSKFIMTIMKYLRDNDELTIPRNKMKAQAA